MKSSGNAFVYVLIAVILFGALSFAISKSNDSSPSSELSDAAAKAAATSILAYESQARTAIDRMIQNGANVANIDFMMPSNASFNAAPTISKLFHPDGGGLQYKALLKKGIGTAVSNPVNGYYIGRFNNVGWTPTSTQDVIFAAYGISLPVCQQIQSKMTGSTTIPALSSGTMKNLFVDASLYSSTNSNFLSANCASCDGMAASCIRDGAITSSATNYTYYSVLVSR